MSGICDICVTADTCEIRRDGRKLCAAYERNSNYNRLFGTPEKAARTLQVLDPNARCRDCAFGDSCDEVSGCIYERDYDALLEWLRGDAE